MAPRSNWLDQWRLFFAALVIVSHSFDLLGHEAQEPLRWITHSEMGLGGVAVWGFFVLSGYLITRSWVSSPAFGGFLRKRVLRIVPAYLVAFAISVLAVGAIGAHDATAYYASLDWLRLGREALTLHEPSAPFPGLYPVVNGAMWTIKYEFLCYLIAPLAVLSRRTLAVAWLVAAVLAELTMAPPSIWLLMFLSGAAYFHFGMQARSALLWISAAAAPFAFMSLHLCVLVLATAGAYLLLCAALSSRPPLRVPDISYGVYLYGWPVQKLLIMQGVNSPAPLLFASLALSAFCGTLSWYGIERWALALKTASGRPGRPYISRMRDNALLPP